MVDRREMLGVAATATATAAPAVAPAPGFAVRPLPFDPKTVLGLSERLLTSHHQNNYGGAVRRLDQIMRALAALDPATTPGFQLNGLKREELLQSGRSSARLLRLVADPRCRASGVSAGCWRRPVRSGGVPLPAHSCDPACSRP